jgi:hypothetical protein
LAKVLLYDLMKHHFNYLRYPGIDFTISSSTTDMERENYNVELVNDMHESFKAFNIKIAAAYARLRIEMKAFGATSREQMENILPSEVREKEDIAGLLI